MCFQKINIITRNFVAGGGIRVDIGNDAKDALTKLLFCYYVWDLSYPKQYQLLGFLQTIDTSSSIITIN
jgi:hypothetical protein